MQPPWECKLTGLDGIRPHCDPALRAASLRCAVLLLLGLPQHLDDRRKAEPLGDVFACVGMGMGLD